MTRIHSLTLISQPPLAPSDAKWTTACPFHFSHGSQKKHCPSVRWQAVCFDISTSVCDRRESDVPKRLFPPEGHCPGLTWPERWWVCGKSLALKAQRRETHHPQDPAKMERRASSGERIHASRLPRLASQKYTSDSSLSLPASTPEHGLAHRNKKRNLFSYVIKS